MRMRRLPWLLLIVLFPLAVGRPEAAPDWDALKAVYDYDASAPLEAEVESVREMPLFTVEQISFTGTADRRVPAVLIRPVDVERPPCVLFLHGLGGDKGQARMAATLLIPQGVAVMGIDAALHGERAGAGADLGQMGPELGATDGPLVRTVVDNQRAIDYIESRRDIDGDRVVLVGVSMGGILGSIVSAVDDRVDAAALLVAGGGWQTILEQSTHPVAQEWRTAGYDDGRKLAHVDPVNFIGHVSPRPVLMINGTEDRIIAKASAEALHDAAGEPKEIIWYDGGHTGMPPDLVLSMAGWVANQVHQPTSEDANATDDGREEEVETSHDAGP